MKYLEERKEIIYWASLMNERGFVTARSGNISLRVKEGVLITSHNCYLGRLDEADILLSGLDGTIIEGDKELTSEKDMHLSIYKNIKDAKVVMHSHSPWTVAFFNYFKELDAFSFEAKFYLGNIKVIPQDTPTVTDTAPVISALKNNNIIVLGNHGAVSIGADFKEAFSLIELLEEQAKINLLTMSTVHSPQSTAHGPQSIVHGPQSIVHSPESRVQSEKRFKLLSDEHTQRLVELVNNDKDAQELGRKYGLTCTLSVKNQDTGEAVCFYYEDGRIIKTDNSEKAEFVIIGKEDILKRVFNREVDPFVASTQGKVKTKGDFTKMSKWYPVLVRTFKLWEKAPVE